MTNSELFALGIWHFVLYSWHQECKMLYGTFRTRHLKCCSELLALGVRNFVRDRSYGNVCRAEISVCYGYASESNLSTCPIGGVVFVLSLLHTVRHTHTFGRTPPHEWSARRRGIYLKHEQTQDIDMHIFSGIRTHDPSQRATAGLRFRPLGHWDRLFVLISDQIQWHVCPVQLSNVPCVPCGELFWLSVSAYLQAVIGPLVLYMHVYVEASARGRSLVQGGPTECVSLCVIRLQQ